MPGGPKLAKLAIQELYHRKVRHDVAGDMVVRDEYKWWVGQGPPYVASPLQEPKSLIFSLHSLIDYYGVTFDHLVPENDTNPEVLQINIVEIEDDAGVYARQHNRFFIDPADYIGKQVLGAPRCCSKRIGTTDRQRINDAVNVRVALTI